VSFDVNPTSRQTLEALARNGSLARLMAAGRAPHQSGWIGCIDVGQAPAIDSISPRTVSRNFLGRRASTLKPRGALSRRLSVQPNPRREC
jgi:aconitate hydratase